MCVLEAEGYGIPVLFYPALQPWHVPSTLWTPHLCKEVPFLNRFQPAHLRGCEFMMQGVPHPGAAFSRPWSLLPRKVPPGQSSLPPSRAGDTLGLWVRCAPWWPLWNTARPGADPQGLPPGLGPHCRRSSFLSFSGAWGEIGLL